MKDINYLKDEVRSGFYIPTAIKQAWAAQLTILSWIERICQKHNIEYFADWGTFLGTVRHGGFVPWDDDMDICMKREDYIRFKQVAGKELPEGYAIHDFESKENHWLFLARVVNTNVINFEKEHLDKFNNFPYIATVDIFILDYLYKDEVEEHNRCDEVKYIIALADGIVKGIFGKAAVKEHIGELSNKYGITIDDKLDSNSLGIELYKLAERQMARVPETESDRIGQIFPWVLKGGKGFPKEYYEHSISLPFENTTMRVSAYYHRALQNHYGDYLKVYKVWGGHGYPYFEGQRRELQAAADFKLPEFTFHRNMLRENVQRLDDSGSLKNMARECMQELERLIQGAIDVIFAPEYDDSLIEIILSVCDEVSEDRYINALNILPSCQQLAIDLGTLIEDVKGTDRECCRQCVAELERLCEVLYQLYDSIGAVIEEGGSIDSYGAAAQELGKVDSAGVAIEENVSLLADTINSVEIVINENIINRGEILFVATGADRWRGFDSIYRKLVEDNSDSDVYVVAVPVMAKDAYGQVVMTDEELREITCADVYPEDIMIASWENYNVELHHPDRIYIQDPYDDENPCLTIPPEYYGRKLREYTDELVYIPYMQVGEFTDKDINDIYNMKHYVTAPGVVYADKIVVQSENMKQRYIEKLTEFTGEEYKAYWEHKIEVDKLPIVTWKDKQYYRKNSFRKKMLFGIGCNVLSECGSKILSQLREKLSVFKSNCDGIDVDVCLYPADVDVWRKANDTLYNKMMGIIDDYTSESWCEFVDINNNLMIEAVRSYDAYYGSPSPFVHLFVNEGKPVMITEFEII